MQKITAHLWFDKEAKEATKFYTSIFPDSEITSAIVIPNTPSGNCDVITFEIFGKRFMAISAGPLFKFNPSMSLMVNFDPTQTSHAREMLDEVWDKLSEGGAVLMPLDKYPFSERFGWVQDKYGLSWQLILTDPSGEERPPIIPALLFVGGNCGRAEEASKFYLSVFKNSKAGMTVRYGPNQAPDQEGSVMFSDFMLENEWFIAMDSAHQHQFSFNEAISFMVNCETQEEIDYYWEKLSVFPEAEQCGWLKDQFGISWQIVPNILDEYMRCGDQKKVARVTEAFLKMKKFNIEKLRTAFEEG